MRELRALRRLEAAGLLPPGLELPPPGDSPAWRGWAEERLFYAASVAATQEQYSATVAGVHFREHGTRGAANAAAIAACDAASELFLTRLAILDYVLGDAAVKELTAIMLLTDGFIGHPDRAMAMRRDSVAAGFSELNAPHLRGVSRIGTEGDSTVLLILPLEAAEAEGDLEHMGGSLYRLKANPSVTFQMLFIELHATSTYFLTWPLAVHAIHIVFSNGVPMLTTFDQRLLRRGTVAAQLVRAAAARLRGAGCATHDLDGFFSLFHLHPPALFGRLAALRRSAIRGGVGSGGMTRGEGGRRAAGCHAFPRVRVDTRSLPAVLTQRVYC